MAESIPLVPGPGEGVVPPADLEAQAVAEAQGPLLDAVDVLETYGIDFDRDKATVVLGVLAADAGRRYRAHPEAFASRTRGAVGAAALRSQLAPSAGPVAGEPAGTEAREVVQDPAEGFASRIAMSYMF